MRLPQAIILSLLASVTSIHALAGPASLQPIEGAAKELFKRKGGGGGGGRGGGASSSSSGGSRGSSSESSSGSSGGRTSASSNVGGSTSGGSGTPPAYGSGGKYYGGGATVPYAASSPRRRSGPAPYLIGGAAVGGIGALGLYGAYVYEYSHHWNYYNRTAHRNESHPANCYCTRYGTCTCDPNNNSTDYQNSVANNASIARLANNGTLYVNGSVENGTTAPGGADDDASAGLSLMHSLGSWLLIAGVACSVWFM